RKASNVQNHFNNHELASPVCLRRLGLPYRSRSSIQAISQTCNDATSDHLPGAVGGDLQDSPNTHDRGANQYRLFPAQPLSEREGGNSAEKASDII
ncbi:MAG: hypothetical protein Q9195_004908, partial [Heterodermia aff. obscurata]